MPDRKWNDMLAEAAGEVLETMFFAGVYGPAPPGGTVQSPHLAARLSFEGTPSGTLTLSVSEPALRALAANFLAADEGDLAAAPQELDGVVRELANMICGALLSRVKSAKGRVFPCRHSEEELLGNNSGAGRPVMREFLKCEAHFRLSSPDMLPDDGDLPPDPPNQSLDLGDGSIDLWLKLDHHA